MLERPLAVPVRFVVSNSSTFKERRQIMALIHLISVGTNAVFGNRRSGRRNFLHSIITIELP